MTRPAQRPDPAAIEATVRELVADSLGRPLEEVARHHSLIDDLGAESIDFLDLQFRVESAFGLTLSGDELWHGAVDREDPRWLQDGRLTAEGLAKLRELHPDFPWHRFPEGIAARDLPRLISVKTICDFVAAHLAVTEPESEG